jgi:hypothetical protein
MRRGNRKKRDGGGGSGFAPYLFLILFVGLPLALFDSVSRSISRSLPGSRGRQAKAAFRRIDKDVKSAAVLARTLASDLPEIEAKIVKYAEQCRHELECHVAQDGWPTDLDVDDSVWARAIDQLTEAGRIAVIDWRSDAEELEEALAPILERHGIVFDWSFVQELEAGEQFDALRNENLLPEVGERLAKQGYVFVSINEGSDSYLMAVCTPADFAVINGLSDHDFFIGKF